MKCVDLDEAETHLRKALEVIETARGISSMHGDPEKTRVEFEFAVSSAMHAFYNHMHQFTEE
jgi:hypothetical protein